MRYCHGDSPNAMARLEWSLALTQRLACGGTPSCYKVWHHSPTGGQLTHDGHHASPNGMQHLEQTLALQRRAVCAGVAEQYGRTL